MVGPNTFFPKNRERVRKRQRVNGKRGAILLIRIAFSEHPYLVKSASGCSIAVIFAETGPGPPSPGDGTKIGTSLTRESFSTKTSNHNSFYKKDLHKSPSGILPAVRGESGSGNEAQRPNGTQSWQSQEGSRASIIEIDDVTNSRGIGIRRDGGIIGNVRKQGKAIFAS